MALTVGNFSTVARAVESEPPAVRAERLAMPYACTVENGSIVTRPGPERAFTIIGGHQQKLFTTCDPPFSNNCRSLTVHRFDIDCGGARVPWIKVVAAIGTTQAGNATLSKGHLLLARRSAKAPGSAPSCADRQSAMSASMSGECLPWRVSRAAEQVVLPEGYAPVREVAARLLDSGAPSQWAAAGLASPGTGVSSSGPVRTDSGPAEPVVIKEPLPEVTLAELTAPATAPPEQNWETIVVAHSTPPESAARTAPAKTAASSLGFAPWLALFGCLALAAAYALRLQQTRTQALALAGTMSGAMSDALHHARRQSRRWQLGAQRTLADWRARETVSDLSATEAIDPDMAAALTETRALFTRTHDLIDGLGTAAVLREVMLTELTTIGARLDQTETELNEASTPIVKIAAQLRLVARDLKRVENTALSAAASIAGAASPIRTPVTAAEAYELLGLRPDVGDAVVQIRISALRHNWSPDGAHDAAERAMRETHIKLIDAAAGLILGSRPAA